MELPGWDRLFNENTSQVKLKVTYFFRHQDKKKFSMERLFQAVTDHLPGHVDARIHYSKYPGSGLLNRLKTLYETINLRGEINHITGDINFITFALPKRKTILTIHDCGYDHTVKGIKRWIIWLFWHYLPVRMVRYVTVISEETKKDVIRLTHISPGKIKVIPNCISYSFQFSPSNFDTDCPKILHVGTKSNKNLNRLSEALKGISCELNIVGKLQEDQKNVLDVNNIKYVNYFSLDESEILNLYHTCDLVSFVTLFEGFGLPILEANAVGRPLITSSLSPMKEIASDAAVLVDPYDVNAIRDGIIRLINDKDLRDQLIYSGLQNVKKYRPDTVVNRYMDLYEEIAK